MYTMYKKANNRREILNAEIEDIIKIISLLDTEKIYNKQKKGVF